MQMHASEAPRIKLTNLTIILSNNIKQPALESDPHQASAKNMDNNLAMGDS
jgi:hypothetical protein